MQVATEVIPLSANIVHAAASEMGLNEMRTQIIFYWTQPQSYEKIQVLVITALKLHFFKQSQEL